MGTRHRGGHLQSVSLDKKTKIIMKALNSAAFEDLLMINSVRLYYLPLAYDTCVNLNVTHLAIVEQNFALLEAERKFKNSKRNSIFTPLEVQKDKRK